MKIESLVRVLAGTLVLLSLALAYFFNPWWLMLAAFVGVNSIQSAFTCYCLAEILLRKFGWGAQDETDSHAGSPPAKTVS